MTDQQRDNPYLWIPYEETSGILKTTEAACAINLSYPLNYLCAEREAGKCELPLGAEYGILCHSDILSVRYMGTGSRACMAPTGRAAVCPGAPSPRHILLGKGYGLNLDGARHSRCKWVLSRLRLDVAPSWTWFPPSRLHRCRLVTGPFFAKTTRQARRSKSTQGDRQARLRQHSM